MTPEAEKILIAQNAQIIALLERLTSAPAASGNVANNTDDKRKEKKAEQLRQAEKWRASVKQQHPALATILDHHFSKAFYK